MNNKREGSRSFDPPRLGKSKKCNVRLSRGSSLVAKGRTAVLPMRSSDMNARYGQAGMNIIAHFVCIPDP